MKHLPTFLLSTLFIFTTFNFAQEECDGTLVTFVKENYADWTLEENQDSLAPTIKLTRKNNQSIFNIAQEDGYSGSDGSPVGTLWANSSTADANQKIIIILLLCTVVTHHLLLELLYHFIFQMMVYILMSYSLPGLAEIQVVDLLMKEPVYPILI